MNCTNKQQETCDVEKRTCKGCYYNDEIKVGDLLHSTRAGGHIGIIVGIDEDNERNKEQYIAEIRTLFTNEKITKLYFDNFIIRDNWAAIHYRFRSVDKKNTKTRVGYRRR